MNSVKAEKLFKLMKQYGVSHFKTLELEINMNGGPATSVDAIEMVKETPMVSTPIPESQAIPPVEIKVPHHINEVASLLKLNDEQLVDKLFPDYSNMPPKDGE